MRSLMLLCMLVNVHVKWLSDMATDMMQSGKSRTASVASAALANTDAPLRKKSEQRLRLRQSAC